MLNAGGVSNSKPRFANRLTLSGLIAVLDLFPRVPANLR